MEKFISYELNGGRVTTIYPSFAEHLEKTAQRVKAFQALAIKGMPADEREPLETEAEGILSYLEGLQDELKKIGLVDKTMFKD